MMNMNSLNTKILTRFLLWARPGQRLIYQLPKPGPYGQTTLALTPLELLDRLAVLIPPPPAPPASLPWWVPMLHSVRR